MIPKQNRFPLRSNSKVFRESRKVSGLFIDVYFPKQPHAKGLAVIVGKTVSEKATVRLYVKRMLTAILREKIKETQNLDSIIIRAKPRVKDATYQQLQDELIRLTS